MQADTAEVISKCPECRGRGRLFKLWPLNAISMPHELAWQWFPCWRCKGTGNLQDDDPYVKPRRNFVATVVAVWACAYTVAAFCIIFLLWL